ncbi:hypothetical protein P4S64_09260 [Vibrio sp. M60_M31a]
MNKFSEEGGFTENQLEKNEQFEYEPDGINPADAKVLARKQAHFPKQHEECGFIQVVCFG